MLLNLVELASNKALEHDPQTRARLSKLQGKTMTLHIKTLEQSITLSPQIEGLEFSRDNPEGVDVTLKATIGAMIKISRANLDIDWESLFSEQIGSGPAKLVVTAAEQLRNFTKESQSYIRDMASHVMKDELDLVADRAEVEAFLDDVDTLRADAERLFARLKNLS